MDGYLISLVEKEVQATHMVSTDTILAEQFVYLIIAWEGWKFRLSPPFADRNGNEATIFFLWFMARVQRLLPTNFVLLSCPLFGPLVTDHSLFLELYLCQLAFLGLLFLQFVVLDVWTLGNSPPRNSSCFEVLSQSATLSEVEVPWLNYF